MNKKIIFGMIVIAIVVIALVPSSMGFTPLIVNQTSEVVVGGNYTVEGTVDMVEAVDIILIGPNGYSKPISAPYLGIEHGFYVTSTQVIDNNFSKNIDMVGATNGNWTSLVLSAGCDNFYGICCSFFGDYCSNGIIEWEGGKYRVFDSEIYSGTFDVGIDKTDGVSNNYAEFDGKTQGQICNVIFYGSVDGGDYSEYAHIFTIMSDDLVWTGDFEVVPAPTPVSTAVATPTIIPVSPTSTPKTIVTPTPTLNITSEDIPEVTPTVTQEIIKEIPTTAPGFEVILTITSLLVIACFILKRRKTK